MKFIGITRSHGTALQNSKTNGYANTTYYPTLISHMSYKRCGIPPSYIVEEQIKSTISIATKLIKNEQKIH